MKTFLLVTIAMTMLAAPPPTVGQAAPDFGLKDVGGTARHLSDVTTQGPVVLIVLRGFPGYQCPLCNRQVAEFVKQADAFQMAGARVVMVYPGPPAMAQVKAEEFVTDKNLPQHFTLLVDPDYTMVHRYNLRWDAPKETAYPATFLLNRKGVITFAKVSNSHGGRTTPAELLSELAKH